MRISNFNSARLAPADRRASLATNQNTLNNIAPHALTSRMTYTVPSEKKAILQFSNLTVTRTDIANGVGSAFCLLRVSIGFGPNADFIRAQINSLTLGPASIVTTPTMIELRALDTIDMLTADTHIAGLVTYSYGYRVMEYDN